MSSDPKSDDNILGRPLELPCGVILKNRLVKAAMSDSLGDGAGNPTDMQARLYERWAEGGAALSLIGEVQIMPQYPEKPGNLVLSEKANLQGLQNLAKRGAFFDAHIWPQLGHAGALSHLPISLPKGPSKLDVDGLQCGALSISEINELPAIYAAAAKMSKTAGFGGVQIHAGHGFLLSQFMSPLFNLRTDDYGGSVAARFRIIHEIIAEVRQTVGPSFPIGIKINSTDKLEGGLTESDALEMIQLLDQTSVDFIDVSGGTYFPGAASSSDSSSSKGAYFTDFTKRAKELTVIPVMATGGFRRRDIAVNAIKNGLVDAVGIARGMALEPELANHWITSSNDDPVFPVFDNPPSGGVTAWYSMRLTALANDEEENFNMTATSSMEAYESRDNRRCIKWRKQFSKEDCR